MPVAARSTGFHRRPAPPGFGSSFAAPAAAGAKHEVKKGDTLWKIAKEVYGDGNLYPEIFKANQDTLSDPHKNQVGQMLRIP